MKKVKVLNTPDMLMNNMNMFKSLAKGALVGLAMGSVFGITLLFLMVVSALLHEVLGDLSYFATIPITIGILYGIIFGYLNHIGAE